MKIFLLLFSAFILLGCTSEKIKSEEKEERKEGFWFSTGLRTNTAKSEIPLNEVLSGGPRKDGIPALSFPNFLPLSETHFLEKEDLGILVQINDEQKFYPYKILYWHEIVNDSLGQKNIAVTFCPLCGSALVFDAIVEGEIETFGVSGKLWQSNLLMYDQKTESLWSQIQGRAVIGDRMGTELTILPSDILSFEEIQSYFPEAQILSDKTGFSRSYDRSPYGNYEENETIMFPINNEDASYHPKELFVLVNIVNSQGKNLSLGFQHSRLISGETGILNTEGRTITATRNENGTISVQDSSGEIIPHYMAMWFSWITHQENEKKVW